jgi:hypothetical protein
VEEGRRVKRRERTAVHGLGEVSAAGIVVVVARKELVGFVGAMEPCRLH